MKTIGEERKLLLKIRLLVMFFIGALIISGITAFPLESELKLACNLLGVDVQNVAQNYNALQTWFLMVYNGVSKTNAEFPFMAYGTDWLAFAHIIIAIAFVGVYCKPVRNMWIVYWAMIACVAVIPLAFICGGVREIPMYWILIDCSFGIFGILPLLLLRYYIRRLSDASGCKIETKY